MGVTIGSLIMDVRKKIPDLPPVVPFTPTLALADSLGFGNLALGTYKVIITQVTPYGEGLPSAEASVTLAVGNSIEIVTTVFPGTTHIRAYITLVGGASGTEMAFADLPVLGPGPTLVFLQDFPTAFGIPPTQNTSYMPDQNGPQWSSQTLYSWLNDALNKLSHSVGGLLDYCGVPTLAGNPLYVIPGQWLSISDVWYGGYWIQGGQRAWFYRRSPIQSDILSGVTISITTDKQVMEVSYQPDRDSGVTALSAGIVATDTSAPIANAGAFLLPFGFAQIGAEIVAYSNLAGNVMAGLIRGIGNTTAQDWLIGTPVTELSLFWCGRRVFTNQYSVGQAATALPVPVGWNNILQLYMLAQAKKAEQDMKAAKDLEDQSFAEAQRWMYSNRGVVSRVQVGGGPDLLVYNQTPAGGVIVP